MNASGMSDGCDNCGISLINVDAAIIGDRWYCPDCVEPKQGKWFVMVTGDIPQSFLYGPFNSESAANTWATNFLDNKYKRNWEAIEVTQPDFSE